MMRVLRVVIETLLDHMYLNRDFKKEDKGGGHKGDRSLFH
jgi:hypothetical protein